MGKIRIPEKAKLFNGIISVSEEILPVVKQTLQAEWGEIDLESEVFPFDTTNYYNEEMGGNLIKKFYSFKKLINREDIIEIKLKTNEIESKIKINKNKKGRDINIDPGYLTLINVTLATTKDYRHRIYIGKGIFLENTLYYDKKAKSYVEWEWTYPDYRKKEYKEFFNKMREIYHKQLRYGENFEKLF